MSSIFDGIGNDGVEQLDENLRKWFKEKWVRFGPDGKIRGACARGDDSEGKPKCLPQKKAQNLGKKGRKYAASKKRREDPNPERRGPAKNVATKKKTNEDIPFNKCPSCRGPIVHESMMNEKQDACYHKVKSRYKVWPSAYASGALVQCRKKGASNWGTGGKKKNESNIMKGIVDETRAKQYVKPYNDPQTGEQIGWVSSDGYHKKYWQKFAKDSAIKHAKLNPDEVQEDYTGEFAAEKTPAINPYGGLKDNQFRGAISETPTDNPTGASGEGGWRKYKPKPAGEIEEDTSYAGGMGQGGNAGESYRKFTPKSAGTFKEDELDEACWKGYHKEGNKKMFGKTYPNCVKNTNEEKRLDKNKISEYNVDDMLEKVQDCLIQSRGQPKRTLLTKLYNIVYHLRRDHHGNTISREELKLTPWLGKHGLALLDTIMDNTSKEEQLDEKCWDTHKQVGMKTKGGKSVPNCVPKESAIMKGINRLT